jgi:hypothetical protein
MRIRHAKNKTTRGPTHLDRSSGMDLRGVAQPNSQGPCGSSGLFLWGYSHHRRGLYPFHPVTTFENPSMINEIDNGRVNAFLRGRHETFSVQEGL